jgi:hypothetical protein
MRPVGLILPLFGLVAAGSAQEVTSDCFREDLTGPVESVEITRIRIERRGAGILESEPRTIRRERYDARCNFERIEYVGSLLNTYWDDEDGRGRRFESEPIPGSTAVTITTPTDHPPVPLHELERGTLVETSYDPATRVLTRTLSQSGRITQTFQHTLDRHLRVIHEVMTDSDGMRAYVASSVFDASGTEVVIEYEYPKTEVRAVAVTGRKMHLFSDTDPRGNWTRRTLYRWEEGGWVPIEVFARDIRYRVDATR